MADETEKLLQDKGTIVLITLRPKKSPVLDVQIAAFQKSLARRGGISAVQTVILDSEPRKASPGMGLSSEKFLTIFEKHAHTDVIVSLVGTPDPGPENRRHWEGRGSEGCCGDKDPRKDQNAFPQSVVARRGRASIPVSSSRVKQAIDSSGVVRFDLSGDTR